MKGSKLLREKKNIVSTYFSNTKQDMHSGKVNVQCLNPLVYKQFSKKTLKLHSNYVKFNPHPHSLNGSSAPDEHTFKKYGFLDVNLALVAVVVALKNAPGEGIFRSEVTREEINTLVIKAMTKASNNSRKRLLLTYRE